MGKQNKKRSGTLCLRNIGKVLPLFLIFFVIPARASFEDVETGARAASMAGAYSAAAGGVSSVFYNPAGLASLYRYEAGFAQQKLFNGLTDGSSISRSALAIGMPLAFKKSYWGSASFAMDTLSLDSLYSESRMRLSYAYPFGKTVLFGLSVARFSLSYGSDGYTALNPVLSEKTAASGIGLDLGVILRKEYADFGLAILNANEPDLGIKYENKVSRKMALGVFVDRENFAWGSDFVFSAGDIKIKAGGELPLFKEAMKKRLLLRAGFAFGSRDYRFLGAGFGYKASNYSVDYSFAYPLSGISGTTGSHQLGLSLAWGTPRGPMVEKEEKKDEEKEKVGESGAGEIVPQPLGVTEPSKADKARASRMIRDARKFIRAGDFAKAAEKLSEADKILLTDQYVKDFLGKMLVVKSILPSAPTDGERDDLVRKAVSRYAEKDTEAVLYVTYAYQKWPRDGGLARLYSVVSKEFPQTAAGMRMLPGITIIDQLLQDALDFIRSNRFVQAIATLQQALQLEPDNIPALTRMGSAYWAMGKKDIARQYWEKVLKLDPNNKEVIQFMKQD